MEINFNPTELQKITVEHFTKHVETQKTGKSKDEKNVSVREK